MKKETLLKIYQLKDRVDADTLKLVTAIVIETFQAGIELGMKAGKEAGNV